MTRRASILAARLILAGVFIYAGAVKLVAPQVFADGIAAFRLLPGGLIDVFALALPPFELLLGAWLATGWRRRSAAFCAACTLAVFLTAIASARLRGLQIDCSCFGGGPAGGETWALGRDILLTAVACVLYVVADRADSGLQSVKAALY